MARGRRDTRRFYTPSDAASHTSAPPPYTTYAQTSPAQGTPQSYHYSNSRPAYHMYDAPDERTPLNLGGSPNTYTQTYIIATPPKSNQKATWGVYICIILLIAGNIVLASLLVDFYAKFPPTPYERELLRKEWEHERSLHQKELEGWEQERHAHDAEVSRTRVEWAHERRAHEETRERMEREREEWERERDGRKTDLASVGRQLGLSWDHLYTGRCVAFGTREYSSRMDFEPRQACNGLPVLINGRTVESPDHCEGTGWDGDIVGHWYVDNDEGCMPHWGKVYDKGCVAPGLHRWETRLWGLHNGEDWHAMCKSTPADIGGMHFQGPTYCQNRGIFYGMVGMFHGTDPRCH